MLFAVLRVCDEPLRELLLEQLKELVKVCVRVCVRGGEGWGGVCVREGVCEGVCVRGCECVGMCVGVCVISHVQAVTCVFVPLQKSLLASIWSGVCGDPHVTKM